MKTSRVLTLLTTVACLLMPEVVFGNSYSDEGYSVPTAVSTKGVLLEEFTGINCGWCPQGHAIAAKLVKASPNVYVVAVHAGSFSKPAPDEPDFRTDEGEEIVNEFGVEQCGYPSGMVNRHDYYNTGNPVCSRSYWKAYTKLGVKETAPVNLLATSTYDGATRKLTVHVEGYYTADSQADNQSLCVLWTQDNIKGPQNGGLVGDDYMHQHVLRGYITDLWGDPLDSPVKGKYFSRDYSITLPESIKEVEVKPGDVRVIAYVVSNKRDVQNVTGCKPVYTNYDMPLGGSLAEPKIPIDSYWGCNFFEMELTNKSDKAITEATFDIYVNGKIVTASWSGMIPSFESKEIVVRCNYDFKEEGQNDYKISLRSINGQSVDESSLEGIFTSPISATPQISVNISTNKEADENHFYIKDADGNIVKEFGPYPAGEVTQDNESVTLDPDKIYYIEVTDTWGDGMYTPMGYYTAHSSDGSLIEQKFEIDDFGTRTLFRTSKEATAIDGVSADVASGDVTVYRLDGTVAYKGKREGINLLTGVYVMYDNVSHTVTKQIIK